MLFSIKYVYVNEVNGNLIYLSEKENEERILSGKIDKNSILGAEVLFFNGKETCKKEIYVGNKYLVEDVVDNKYNANALNVRFPNVFLEQAKRYDVSKIIQFPQINKINGSKNGQRLVEWRFLEGDEVVIPWDCYENIYQKLDSSLQLFKKMATGYEEKSFANMSSKYPYESRVNSLTLRRHVSSR